MADNSSGSRFPSFDLTAVDLEQRLLFQQFQQQPPLRPRRGSRASWPKLCPRCGEAIDFTRRKGAYNVKRRACGACAKHLQRKEKDTKAGLDELETLPLDGVKFASGSLGDLPIFALIQANEAAASSGAAANRALVEAAGMDIAKLTEWSGQRRADVADVVGAVAEALSRFEFDSAPSPASSLEVQLSVTSDSEACAAAAAVPMDFDAAFLDAAGFSLMDPTDVVRGSSALFDSTSAGPNGIRGALVPSSLMRNSNPAGNASSAPSPAVSNESDDMSDDAHDDVVDPHALAQRTAQTIVRHFVDHVTNPASCPAQRLFTAQDVMPQTLLTITRARVKKPRVAAKEMNITIECAGSYSGASEFVVRLTVVFISSGAGVFRISKVKLPKRKAAYVQDETYPDHTKVKPGALIQKKWRVKNTGDMPWKNGEIQVVNAKNISTSVGTLTSATARGAEQSVEVQFRVPANACGPLEEQYRLSCAGECFGDVLILLVNAEP